MSGSLLGNASVAAYYREFGDPSALEATKRAADLIVKTYLNQKFDMRNDGSYGQMNYASFMCLRFCTA